MFDYRNEAVIKTIKKMKIVVDLEDFWFEEDEQLIPALQDHVKTMVIRQIGDSIKKQVDLFMDKAIKEEINSQLEMRVKILMEAQLETGKVKGRYSGDQEMTIQEWVSKEIKTNSSNIHDYVLKTAKAQGEDLKRRYDLLFASQIVAKINEQGLLKDDVAKLLLPKE